MAAVKLKAKCPAPPLALFLLACCAAPALCAEVDFTFKKQEQAIVPKHSGENEVETIARILQSISTLEGVTYYSQRRKRETVLYPRCYMVEDAKSRKKVPDSYDHMNAQEPAYYLQEDNSLGAAVYEAVFRQNDASAGMDVYNFDPLKMGPIVLVPSRGMHLRVLVTDKGDALEVDVLMEAALRRSNFAANYMDRSLQARFEAVFRWFESMYAKEV
jgi:hypothetical protein